MKTERHDNLRLVLAEMMRDNSASKNLGEASDNLEKHLPRVIGAVEQIPRANAGLCSGVGSEVRAGLKNAGDVINELRLKLRDADIVMKAIDETVKRGALGSRSMISDARLNYGDPYDYKYS